MPYFKRKEDETVRAGAMALGIIGGIIGLIIGIVTWTLGALAGEAGAFLGGEAKKAGALLALWGFLVFAFAIAGLVGGAMAKAKPLAAGILMLIGGVGGFISGWFWLFCGILLLIGGVLALIGRKEAESTQV